MSSLKLTAVLGKAYAAGLVRGAGIRALAKARAGTKLDWRDVADITIGRLASLGDSATKRLFPANLWLHQRQELPCGARVMFSLYTVDTIDGNREGAVLGGLDPAFLFEIPKVKL